VTAIEPTAVPVALAGDRYRRAVAQRAPTRPVGDLLRSWRERRRRSQLDLASEAGVSTRHLSFVETGRARPSRELVLHLAEHLDVPLRDRNALLVAAGHAPVFRETSLETTEMDHVRATLDHLMRLHLPSPALVVDRRWDMVTANDAALLLTEGVAPALLEPPVNVLRLTFSPDGLAPRLANLGELRTALLGRLHREVLITGNDELGDLLDELRALPGEWDPLPVEGGELFVPFRLRTDDGERSFFTTIATFGTAIDITLAELSIEVFHAADAETAAWLQDRLGSRSGAISPS
jgi:transcriptional regulator with XRE-family HTH domain